MLELRRQHFPYIVVDMGRGFSELNLAAIERATNILIVCTPDRVGMRGVAEYQRIFGELLRMPLDPLQLASIPFDGGVPTRAALEGHPIVSRWAHSPVARTLHAVANRMHVQATEVAALVG